MTKRQTVTHEFVDFIPDQLDEGVIYIALEYGTVVHLCCDGCGERVSTPLHPAQWKLIFDGETISLRPSVGSSGLPCNSHYIISSGHVKWCRPLDDRQAARDHHRDISVVDEYFKPAPAPLASSKNPAGRQASTQRQWWRRLFSAG